MTEDALARAPDSRAEPNSKQRLRLWLRLLSCANLVERDLRVRFREHFESTLPRFDVLAMLERAGDGITMGELSRRLMVSNGNVTGLVDRLERQGLIRRWPSPEDSRVWLVALTDRGRAAFETMAAEHERWVDAAFDCLSGEEVDTLLSLLTRVKQFNDRAPTRGAKDEGEPR